MKLSENTLRSIIAEELKKLSEGPFKGETGVMHLVMTDKRVHEAIEDVIGAVVDVCLDRGVLEDTDPALIDEMHVWIHNGVAEAIEDAVMSAVDHPKDEPYEEDEMLRQSKLPDEAWANDPNNPKREGRTLSMRKALAEIEEMHMDEEDVELPPMHPKSRPDSVGTPRAAERSPEETLGKPPTAPRRERFGGGMGGGWGGTRDDGPVDLPPMHPRMMRK